MGDYRVWVRGPGGLCGGRVSLDCDSDEHALAIAGNIDSPFGHELRVGNRLLGLFEAGWGADFPNSEAED